MDCYFVIKKIASKMLALFSGYAKKISRVTDDLIPEINYILENMDYEFYNIDEEFKFLEEFPLFNDIYINMKKRINIQLLRCLENELKKKKEIENSPINTYEKLRVKEYNNRRTNFKKSN